MLYKVPLPGVTGITGIYRNVGSVKNNGFEVSLGVDILEGGDWNWSVAANFGLETVIRSLWNYMVVRARLLLPTQEQAITSIWIRS